MSVSGILTQKREANALVLSVNLPFCFLRSLCFFRPWAEREGFEPPEQLPVHRISSAARSTTPASFLKRVQSYKFFEISLQKSRLIFLIALVESCNDIGCDVCGRGSIENVVSNFAENHGEFAGLVVFLDEYADAVVQSFVECFLLLL